MKKYIFMLCLIMAAAIFTGCNVQKSYCLTSVTLYDNTGEVIQHDENVEDATLINGGIGYTKDGKTYWLSGTISAEIVEVENK